MDRRRLRRSYASRSSELQYARWQEEDERARREYLENQHKRPTLKKERVDNTLSSAQKEPVNTATATNTANSAWDVTNTAPESISRNGSTWDDRNTKNDFASFLEDIKNKTFNTVAQRYEDKPFFVEMNQSKNDPKVKEYLDKTNVQHAKKIQLNKDFMAQRAYVESTKDEDYGVKDWMVDAYRTFRIAQNQAQADAYAGQMIRSREIEDKVNNVLDFSNKQILLQTVKDYFDAWDLLDAANNDKSSQKTKLVQSATQNLNNLTNKLKQYYGKQFDPKSNLDDFNKLVNSLESLKEDTKYSDDLYTLRDIARSHGDPLSVTAKALHLISRDRIESDAFDTLRDLDTEDPVKRINQLNNYLKRSENTKRYLREKELGELKERDDIGKPSQYFTNRVELGSKRMQNGESWWNLDNVLYSQIQQQGFSNSSWGSQLASMALTGVGSMLNDTEVGSLVGAPMVIAGSKYQYEASRDENNAEVVENAKKRVSNALKGEYNNKTNYYNLVMQSARKLSNYKDKTDDEILQAIVTGVLPVTAKADHIVSKAINDEIVNARQGANVLYDKDMAAVASDAATDALIWGSTGVSKVTNIIGSAGSKVGGKLLAGAEKKLNESAKYRMARMAAHKTGKKLNKGLDFSKEYLWARGGDLSTYAEYLGQGGYVVGAVTKPIISTGSKLLDTKAGKAILNSEFASKTAAMADKVVEFGRAIPNYLLKKASDKSGISKFEIGQFSKRQAFKIGNLVVSGISEEIEEGKQYLNAQEWVNNADPDQVANTFDIMFSDLSKLVSLMPASVGVPLGLRWGLAKDSELFENMAGGMLGGFTHGAAILGVKDLFGEVSNAAGWTTSQRSIDHMIATNAYLDNRSTIGRLEAAEQLAKKIGSANTSRVLLELNAFEEFNNKQKELGEYSIEQELIDDQRQFILSVNSEYSSKDTENQAESAGIKKGSDDYNRFVAAKVLYKENAEEARQNYNDAINQINQYLNQLSLGSTGSLEDDILEQSVGASGEFIENPILKLFESISAEEVEEKSMTKRERKEAKRAKNKADRAEKRRQRLINKGESDEIADEILENSVAAEESSISTQVNNARRIRLGSSIVTELISLTRYLDALNNTSQYSDVTNKNDIKYINSKIEERINELKKCLPKNKIQHILDNPELYLNAIENADELIDAHRTKMAASIELDTAENMSNLLTGKKDNNSSSNKNPWGVNNARQILDAIQKTIDDKYDLIDRVNMEFQERNFGTGTDTHDNIVETAADEELDQMLSSQDEIESQEPEPSIEPELQPLPQPQPEPSVLPIQTDAPSVADLNAQIAQQEANAALTAVDIERQNINAAYRNKLAEDNDAVVVDSEDEITTTDLTGHKNVVVLNPTTKDYNVYSIDKDGNVLDQEGIFVVKDGRLIPKDQRIRAKEQLGKDVSHEQKQALQELEDKIREDNSKVVGVTGHDYFIKGEDGKIHMYPRVHTVMGDQYEDSAEMDKDFPESLYNKNLRAIRDLISDNKIDELKQLISSIKNHDLYLQVLQEDDSASYYIAKALAELLTRQKPGVGVNVGQCGDELARIFFDRSNNQPFEYETLEINVGFDDKVYPVSSLMSKETFELIKQQLIVQQKTYDELGYVLSTTRHVWHAPIKVDGKYVNVAGETDIIAIDKNGDLHIIDTKTSKYSFKDGSVSFDQKRALFNRLAKRTTREQYAMLLSYYMSIIKAAMPNVTFAENPIELLPIIVKYDNVAMLATIDKLMNGEIPNYDPISSMIIGLNDEPNRVLLTPVDSIINGTFDFSDDASKKLDVLKTTIETLSLHAVTLLENLEDIQLQLTQHHQSLAGILDSVKLQIQSVQNKLNEINGKLSDQLDGAFIDLFITDMFDIQDQLMESANKIDDIYQQNITKIFNDEPYSPSEDEQSADQEFHNSQYSTVSTGEQIAAQQEPQSPTPPPVPTVSYDDDADSWSSYNTADRRLVNLIVSDDNDKIKLSSVTGNEDFATNSTAEVVDIRYDRNTALIICDITYDEHVYRGVSIQVAQNNNGVQLLLAVRLAIAYKQNGQKVVLTGMDRTAGLTETIQETPISNIEAITGNIDIYDLSTESSQARFGLAKMNKNGLVEVHAQGASSGTTSVIYIFNRGKGVPGIYNVVIKPNHHNATIPTKPLAVPIFGSKLNDGDIQLLFELFDTINEYGNVNNKYEYLSAGGTVITLPYTHKDLIEFFLPYGDVSSRNTARHVKIEGDNVIFTQFNSDGVTIKTDSFNLKDNNSRQQLYQYISMNVKFNLQQDKIDSRLGANVSDKHPFKTIANTFNRHPELNEIRLGDSRISFSRTDFQRPNGTKDGLSGLGWMVKNQMISSTYGGISNPRFSYTGVETIDSNPSETPQIEQIEPDEVDVESFTPDDIAEIDDFVDDIQWDRRQSDPNPSRKTRDAEAKLKRMFGSRVNVRVAARLSQIFTDVKIPAGAVGAMIRGAIGIQTNAERGTEYHEAFHLVSRVLLPSKMRKKLYKFVEKALLRDEAPGTLEKLINNANKQELDGIDPKEYVLEEYGAELCRKYFNDIEDIDFSITKTFDYIKAHANAYRLIGDWRLAVLFTAMRMRAFALHGLRMSKSTSESSLKWLHKVVYTRNGVSYNHVLNDVMYDKLIKSMSYYIFKLLGVRPDGSNLANLNLSKEELEKERTFKSAGREWTGSIKKAIVDSCKAKVNGEAVQTATSLAIEEMFENYEQTYNDLKRYADEIGVDYHEKDEQAREDAMVDGEDDVEAGGGNTDHNYDKASYEVSRVTKATVGIKFYTSTIRAFGEIVDVLDKDGKPVIDKQTNLPKKKVKYKRNEFGLYEYMDHKDVLVTLLHKLHDVKSKKQMLKRINLLAQSDPLFYQLAESLNTKQRSIVRKDGSVNYSQELILTQFFNLMASCKNNFMRVQAVRNNTTGMWTLNVEECGQKYESSQYRMEWGRILTYGGTALFDRDENGNLSVKQIGRIDGVEMLGYIFDKMAEIREEFSQYRINELNDHGAPKLQLRNPNTKKMEPCNVTTENGCNLVINTLCSMFNYIGIQFDAPEFRYMLQEKYGSKGFTTILTQLQQFFSETGESSIENLYGPTSRDGYGKKLIRKERDGKWVLNVVDNKTVGKNIPVENVFVNNSFTSELSEWKYKYQHSTTDLSVLVSNNKTMYEISENSTITDITDELTNGGQMLDNLRKFCYNYMDLSAQDESGNSARQIFGSVLLKKAIEAQEKGVTLPLQVNTLTQFKTNDFSDQGSDYFGISEREDYASKTAILESGGLIFPTMSDKKTWVYLTGVTLPGLSYNEGRVEGLNSDDVLNQLVEYAELERATVEQTIAQLKVLPDSKKVTNFHKGAKITDKNGQTYVVANGTLFGSLTGVWVDGKFESFTDQLDADGNYISPEENLKKAKRLFFDKSQNEKIAIMRELLERKVDEELQHITGLGLIEKTATGYTNKGLNDAALSAIARTKFNYDSNKQTNSFEKDICIRDYVRDIVSKSIISIHEVERCYSGHPGFFKYKFDKNGHLTNRHEDEFKRFGGLISTGTNNNQDIENGPADNKYTCAVVNNEMIQSPEIDYIVECIETSEWKAALRQVLNKGNVGKNKRKQNWKRVSEMNLEDVKKELLDTAGETAYNIIANKVEKETNSYRKDDKNKGIDVADGGAYISPEMTKWLLLMCGEYNNKVDKAFKILMNSDKYDAVSVADAYSTVQTSVIGAQKYTAYGQRLSDDGKTMIPYYNKMALFPVFKCMASGRFAKIYDQMVNNKNADGTANPIHMLMVQSAIKLGDEGSIDYDASAQTSGFNTYKQDFKFLRKQFNTNPHHKEDQSMGTQMVKVALTSIIPEKDYTVNGKTVTGSELLDDIMKFINDLTEIGRQEFDEKIYENGEISPKKLSEFLIDQMSSRDADKSMIDALKAIEIKDDQQNTIGWKLKHPLESISGMNWLQSVLKAIIDKKMVEIHTYGNAFYQRSIWGMEGHGADYVSDENIAQDINGGKELQMIVKDGPAKGAMECVLTMDYFHDVLKEAGLEKATFSEQKKALMDAGIIGPKAKANLIGYRIPTQAQSSIHSLVCVDVIPVLNHNIILPKEFTKITGSDFDIDKIFIASLNYKLKKDKNSNTYSIDAAALNEKQQTQNNLLERYLTLLCDEEGMHVANRSIDNDTDLILDVLEDLESGTSNSTEQKYVTPFDFYTLSKHTSTKLNFLTGKTGIGPFALNNNSQILTTLYGVQFSQVSFMNKLGRTSLHDQQDMDGQSIMSWISALINAHVDIAKDPYISRMNVNEMTYNLVNLLIRTGYGKRTFYFTKQPVMIKMAEKYRQAQGSFLQDKSRSKWEIKNEAKQDGVLELVGKPAFDKISNKLGVNPKRPYGSIEKYAVELLEGPVLRQIARGDISLDSNTKISLHGDEFTPKEIQVLVYYLDKALETPAQAISDLVKYSKIDTKKQGKNVSEQLAYLKGVAATFDDPSILKNLFGRSHISHISVRNANIPQFETSGIRRMYENSFIKNKTHAAITKFMKVMDGQVFEATPGFQNLLDRMCQYLDKTDANSISTISKAISAKLKADAIIDYANTQGIDIHGLVSGNNTIYDRLNSIKIRLKSDPEYADIANNALLNLLIADKHWKYDPSKHPNNVVDRFENLKFIRLFDAMDKSNAKKDYIISAWEALLQDGRHPEIREFARDLCVYAFVTSGDGSGRTKLFSYVPNIFREESGYVERIEELLQSMQDDPDYGLHMFTDSFIDDIVLNNQDNSVFVKTIDVTNKKLKPGNTVWKPIIMNRRVPIGNTSYKPSYPIFITCDMSTPADATKLSPFIKVSHMTRNTTDNSSRAESIYKLVAFVPAEVGTGYPVYVKVNSKGYHIQGGYDFFEYGTDVHDSEYVPNIYNIQDMIQDILDDKDAWDNAYGEGFSTVAEILYLNIDNEGYRQTANYNSRVVYVDETVTAQQDELGNETVDQETEHSVKYTQDQLNDLLNKDVTVNSVKDGLHDDEISVRITSISPTNSGYRIQFDIEDSGKNYTLNVNDEFESVNPNSKFRDFDVWDENLNPTSLKIYLANKYKRPVSSNTEQTSESAITKESESTRYDAEIQYTPTGKERLTYYIKGSHIYNKNGREVFASDSVDRTRIFANLAIRNGRAVVVEYRGVKYVVNDKDKIVSVQTGKLMQWGEENGDRNTILQMAKPKLESVAKLMQENKKGLSNENLKC